MKAVKAVVIGMGILILLGLGVVVAAIVSRVGEEGEAEKQASAVVGLDLPSDCRLSRMVGAADYIALRLEGPRTDRCPSIVLLSPESGKVVRKIYTRNGPTATRQK